MSIFRSTAAQAIWNPVFLDIMADQNAQARKPIPGTEKMEEAIIEIDKEVAIFKARLDELQKEIDSKETGKEEYFERRKDMQEKLAQYDEMIKNYEDQKQSAWGQIDSSQAQARDQREKLNKEKSKLKFKSVEDIDKEISRIENRMMHESFTVAQERKMIAEISALKATKPQIAKVQALEVNKGDKKSDSGDVKEKISFLNQHLNDARDAKRSQMGELKKLNDKRAQERSKVDHLFEERNVIRAGIRAKNEEKRSKIDEKREFEKMKRAEMAEKRAVQSEKQRANRLKKEADDLDFKLKRDEDWEPERPKLLETTRLEQMIRYCKGLVGETFEKVEEVKAEVVHDQPKGFSVLAKKKDREQTKIVVGDGKKKVKKEKKVKKDDKIKHTVESLKMFSQFNVSPPLTTEDIPPIVEKLQEQLEIFMKEVKVWEADCDKRAADRKKALDEAKTKVEELKKKAEAAMAAVGKTTIAEE